MKCIICGEENVAKSEEHIVPESFGNQKYIIERGAVCDECNSRFSKFEEKAMTKTIFLLERIRHGTKTKKGKNAKGKINKLGIEGDKNFKKNLVNFYNIEEEDVKRFDPKTGEFDIKIDSLFKSEEATAKMLLKIGIESIYQSQRKLFKRVNFLNAINYLHNKDNNNWPFLESDVEIKKFKWIPRFSDKRHLVLNNINIKYCEYNEHLLFKFKFGAIPMVISLTNRDLDWMHDFFKEDKTLNIYPKRFKYKIVNSTFSNSEQP